MQRQSNNFRPEFTDEECITVYLWGISQRRFEQKTIYRTRKTICRSGFPNCPAIRHSRSGWTDLRQHFSYWQKSGSMPLVWIGTSQKSTSWIPVPSFWQRDRVPVAGKLPENCVKRVTILPEKSGITEWNSTLLSPEGRGVCLFRSPLWLLVRLSTICLLPSKFWKTILFWNGAAYTLTRLTSMLPVIGFASQEEVGRAKDQPCPLFRQSDCTAPSACSCHRMPDNNLAHSQWIR